MRAAPAQSVFPVPRETVFHVAGLLLIRIMIYYLLNIGAIYCHLTYNQYCLTYLQAQSFDDTLNREWG